MSTVLVVDDDNDIRTLLSDLLRLSGFLTRSASSGLEALAQLDAGAHPDLVLLDVQMPELDGWDTLRRIRASDQVGDLPVLLCTVKASMTDRALGWALGCDGYVAKPFAIEALVTAVHGVLAATPDERAARRRAAVEAITEADRLP